MRYFFLHVIPCSLVERYVAVSLANANIKMFVSGMKQILLVYGFRSCVHCLITLSKKKKNSVKKKKSLITVSDVHQKFLAKYVIPLKSKNYRTE